MLNALKARIGANSNTFIPGYIETFVDHSSNNESIVYGDPKKAEENTHKKWGAKALLGSNPTIRINMLKNVKFIGVNFGEFNDADFALLANVHERKGNPFFPIQSLTLDKDCKFGDLGIVGFMEWVLQSPTMTSITFAEPKQTPDIIISLILQAIRNFGNTTLSAIAGLDSSVKNSQTMKTLDNVLKRNELIGRLSPFMNKKSLTHDQGGEFISVCRQAKELYPTLEKEDQKPLNDAIEKIYNNLRFAADFADKNAILSAADSFFAGHQNNASLGTTMTFMGKKN